MIEYAGQPLLLEDPEGVFSSWLARSFSLSDLRIFGAQPVAFRDGRWIPRSSARERVGLSVANWNFPAGLKINTLWWPTGASRWSIGLYLCGQDTLGRVLDGLDSNGGATLRLEEAESDGVAIETEMFLLPPRPLTTPPDSGDERLFLLPLVDDRYFWQFRDSGLMSPASIGTWTAMLSHLATQLGIDTMVIAPDAYDNCWESPDPVELTRHYENAAMLLDVVAWCVGKRVIRRLDGDVYIDSAATSRTYLFSDNLSESVTRGMLAGGFSSGTPGESEPYYEDARRPAKVRVVFPRYSSADSPCASGDVYAVDVDGAAYSSATTTSTTSTTYEPDATASEGRVKTFHDTAAAIYDAPCEQGPVNEADLQRLACTIARSYYEWLDVETYDVSFPGLKAWRPTGYDDAICWHWGGMLEGDARDPDGDHFGSQDGAPYAAYTRVSSLPVDWGYSQLLHQFDPDDIEDWAPTTTPEPSTTTTTQDPAVASGTISACVGQCRWTWDGHRGVWVKVWSQCGQNTTTTTSTTSSTTSTTTTSTTADPATTTSTTADPCECPPGAVTVVTSTTTTSTTSTTTTSTTTTTTVDPTTTTSHDPCATTSTTVEAATTSTTLDPQNCAGCKYFRVPDCNSPGSERWVLVEDNCSAQWTDDDGVVHTCQCPLIPTYNLGGYTTSDPCNYITLPCTVSSVTPLVPTNPACVGSCTWLSSGTEWFLICDTCTWKQNYGSGQTDFGRCLGGDLSACCNCVPPSVDPEPCGVMLETPCGSGDGDCDCLYPSFCGREHGECTYTYCSRTRNEHPECTICQTTTTPEPCEGGCYWRWYGSAWGIISDTCGPTCPCPLPGYDGTDPLCEVAWTVCGAVPPTTTSTTSTTSTTTSTTEEPSTSTTSEPPSCSGTASYRCQDTGGGIYGWVRESGTCTGGCYGIFEGWTCGDSSPTQLCDEYSAGQSTGVDCECAEPPSTTPEG